MDKKTIVDYYEYTRRFYRLMWHGDTGGIHYGFWDKNTKNHKQALLNTNKFLSDFVNVQKTDNVLDAGCGVGGSALWLAENIGCTVSGITLSPSQLRKANEVAEVRKLSKLLNFSQQDYTSTNFPDSTFSVIWAIESVCHAEDKKDFINEAYRLLKPGGRLVVWDGFLMREPENDQEEKQLSEFLEGWSLTNLSYKDTFEKDLETRGFQNINSQNIKKAIWPESKIIYRMTLWGYPFTKLTQFLRLTSPILTKNNLAGLAQYHIIKNDLMNHVAFSAFKP